MTHADRIVKQRSLILRYSEEIAIQTMGTPFPTRVGIFKTPLCNLRLCLVLLGDRALVQVLG